MNFALVHVYKFLAKINNFKYRNSFDCLLRYYDNYRLTSFICVNHAHSRFFVILVLKLKNVIEWYELNCLNRKKVNLNSNNNEVFLL